MVQCVAEAEDRAGDGSGYCGLRARPSTVARTLRMRLL